VTSIYKQALAKHAQVKLGNRTTSIFSCSLSSQFPIFLDSIASSILSIALTQLYSNKTLNTQAVPIMAAPQSLIDILTASGGAEPAGE
jgi:hypothetical protein